MTFDVTSDVHVGISYTWQHHFEISAVCRKCGKPSLVLITLEREASSIEQRFRGDGTVTAWEGDLAGVFHFERIVGLADLQAKAAPADLPESIESAFNEGARCLAIGCLNASSAMFRLCLDLATRGMLPPEEGDGGPSKHERRNLAPRLTWLFEHSLLPNDLRTLSEAVKGNGDEGAHEGALDEAEAEDIFDFAYALLDRLYSEPARLKAAMDRRQARREGR